MNIPTSFTAGDTLEFSDSLSDYPASSGWVLSYVLVKDGSQISMSSTADGDDHSFSIPATTTANYSPGTYHWKAFVTNAPERYTVDSGVIEIEQDFTTQAQGFDDRSHVKKTLDALESVLEGKASADVASYSIGGRSLSKMTPEELLSWRDKYRAEYHSEQVANGNSVQSRKVRVRFV